MEKLFTFERIYLIGKLLRFRHRFSSSVSERESLILHDLNTAEWNSVAVDVGLSCDSEEEISTHRWSYIAAQITMVQFPRLGR